MSCLLRRIGANFCRHASATVELLRFIPEQKNFIPSVYLNTKS